MGFFDRFRKKKDISPGGSKIYRYGAEPDYTEIPEESGKYAQEVTARFEKLFPGRQSGVLREVVSEYVQLDVHILRPTAEQNFFVVYTTGMSDRPMTIPQDIPAKDRESLELAELYMMLPGDWKLEEGAPPTQEVYWPILLMRFLARFPHEYKSWLASGHTVPNGPDYDPYDASTALGGAVLVGGGEGELGHLTAKDGRRINLLCVMPAYKEEVEYKLKYGMEALDKLFQAHEVSPVLDIHRPNLCADFKEVLD